MNSARSICKKTPAAGFILSPARRVKVHQDVELYLAAITKEQKLNYRVKTGRQAWLQITRGVAACNGTSLAAGDGAAVSKEVLLQIDSSDNAEVLLFDLP